MRSGSTETGLIASRHGLRTLAHIGYDVGMHRPAGRSTVTQSRLAVWLSMCATRWRELWKGYWSAPRGC
jgi:hypothetical protein